MPRSHTPTDGSIGDHGIVEAATGVALSRVNALRAVGRGSIGGAGGNT